MTEYTKLSLLVGRVHDGNAPHAWDEIIAYLTTGWLDDYERSTPSRDIVETTSEAFSYLFDVHEQRLIAAYGVSHGLQHALRDKRRMAGHPLSAGPQYHRGHAIAHSLGGPTDINLVPQLGPVNTGPFRFLEKQAAATPGALYFTHWRYDGRRTQTPIGVEQGLLVPGRAPHVETHRN